MIGLRLVEMRTAPCTGNHVAPAARSLRAALVLLLSVGATACLSSKRLSYIYEPTYGVESPQFANALEGLACRMVPGNEVTLLNDGDELFPALRKAMEEAKCSINIETYIFAEGTVGDAFARLLADKARQGVAVRLLVDGVGARLGRLEPYMRVNGVRVEIYKPLTVFTLHRIGDRTHRKIVTVDGRVAFTGGFAFDDRWQGHARDAAEWRDVAVRLEGPIVSQLQRVFMQDWMHTTGEVLHDDGQFPPVEMPGNVLAQAVASSGADPSSLAKLHYFAPIQAARRRIWIENAYFVPDRDFRRALMRAAERGVDVRLLVPGRLTDIRAVRWASRYHYRELLRAGVRIYEYRPTMLHSKLMVVDGIFTSIGSMNFVSRTMKKNAEANVAIYDRAFAQLVEAVYEEDLQRSERVTLEQWRHRGLFERFREAFFALFSLAY